MLARSSALPIRSHETLMPYSTVSYGAIQHRKGTSHPLFLSQPRARLRTLDAALTRDLGHCPVHQEGGKKPAHDLLAYVLTYV